MSLHKAYTLGNTELQVITQEEQLHRCGKTTTTLMLRNNNIDVTIIAEGKLDVVCAQLGLVPLERIA